VVLGVWLVIGCGGGAKNFVGTNAIEVPPGVSPIVAAHADSIAAGLFVTLDRERQARELAAQGIHHYAAGDSLWAVLDAAKETQKKVSAEDSVAAIRQAITGTLKLQEAGNNLQDFDRIQEQRLIIQASYNLKEAQKYLEKSVQLDPFNTRVQNYLALTYKLLAQRFPQDMTFENALRVWGALARLEPGEYLHFYNLGSAYFAAQHWRQAQENFKKTEALLLASADFNHAHLQNPTTPAAASLDTTTLLSSIYYQALSAIKLYDANQALQDLHRAKQLTHAPEARDNLDSYIGWLNWDDGNIIGSVMRDSADALAHRGQFAEASKIYEDLINQFLTTKRARDEVIFTYAVMEYQNLDRKTTAVSRLYEVVQSLPKDTGGASIDPAQQKYFDNYGIMCHNLGFDTLQNDRRLAYMYFSQAAAINWTGRGKSYLAMAELASTNPEISVQNAEKAEALAEQLAHEELLKLYKLLVDGNRRLNQMDKARLYYEKFKALQ
jgi:hypothetical protein